MSSNLSSVQTLETDSGTHDTEAKLPPVKLVEQDNKPSDDESTNERTDHSDVNIDKSSRSSHVFQQTSASIINHNSMTMSQQEAANDQDKLSVDQSLPKVNQNDHSMDEDIQSTDQHEHSVDHNAKSVDTDMQSTNPDEQCIDQDEQCINQDNPFSHLLLFSDSDSDNNDVTLKTSVKKRHKAKPKSPAGNRKKKTERKIPDSFIAVRFSSPELKQKLALVQEHMVEMNKKLKPTMIPLVKLHVTLMTLQLNNDVSLIEK